MDKNKENYYYDICADTWMYPEAWCYIIIGGRNTGKTYSALKDCVLTDRKFVFIKRTNDDVDLLCSGSGRIGTKQTEFGVDLSPFKPINRDLGTDIRAYSIKSGLGGFWKHVNGEIQGAPIGYLLSLNAVSKFKGFDLSDCDWIIFDEFIPNVFDRVNRKEGEQLMELYKTVARDREHRGKPPLKLVCLANATSISNPVMNTLEVTDTVADMAALGKETWYDEERKILVHQLKTNSQFLAKEKESAIYQAMGNTSWGEMAFENQFAYNDFSNVKKVSLKGYKPVCSVKYKTHHFYVWRKDEKLHMCKSKHNSEFEYDLSKENDQKKFWNEQCFDLRLECIDGNMTFETYTMYDLIMNYKSFYKL